MILIVSTIIKYKKIKSPSVKENKLKNNKFQQIYYIKIFQLLQLSWLERTLSKRKAAGSNPAWSFNIRLIKFQYNYIITKC